MRKAAVLGSTGSIGTQTLEIVREFHDIEITALAAGRNIELLEKQVREFRPAIAAVYDEEKAAELKQRLSDLPVRVVSGMDGLIEAAAGTDAEIVVGAIVGMIGIRPVMEAIRAGKDIALANKETLVCAGHLIMPLAKACHVRILPVDSEHSAIFQCLRGEADNPVEKILLTASGGPFRGYTKDALQQVTKADALKHPNWSMGQKITIDSATMVNKALEVMEAGWLFEVPLSKIQIVVQPKSVIHSMVEFRDGAVKAQLGTPDMRLPISYALYYPERRPIPGKRLAFDAMQPIEVAVPDRTVFEALDLGLAAGNRGGNVPTVFNAANEYAVARFLAEKIRFTDIIEEIRYALERVEMIENPSLSEVLETERATYEVLSCLQS